MKILFLLFECLLLRYWTVRPRIIRPIDNSSNEYWSKDNSSNGTIRPIGQFVQNTIRRKYNSSNN
jgi:hypothetical protein